MPAIWLPSSTPLAAICFSSRATVFSSVKRAQHARLAVVQQGVEQGDRADPVVALLGQVRGQHGGQRPAQAQPDDVDLGRAGDLTDDVQRLPRAVDEVVVQGGSAHGRLRIAVGDGEHGALVLDRPLQEAASRRQVHDVVLVDPRRAGQHRDRADLLGLRRVLDQLHQVVPEHDLAGGGGQVLPDPERPQVHLTRPAAVVDQVVDHVPGPGEHAGPARLQHPLERGRVGQQEVGRRERVEQEAGGQRGLGVVGRVAATRPPACRSPAGRRPGSPAGGRRRPGCRSTSGPRTACHPRAPGPAAPRPGPASGPWPPARPSPHWSRSAASRRPSRPAAGPPGRQHGQRGLAQARRIHRGEHVRLGSQHPRRRLRCLPRRFWYGHALHPPASAPSSASDATWRPRPPTTRTRLDRP